MTIITDKEINLDQLDKELGSYGLCADFNNPKAKIIKTADNSPISDEELEIGIKNHLAIDEKAEAAIKRAVAEAKLAALGLTVDDLRALGL